MLIRLPPKSSTERVREFRQRNPGYDRRYAARKRAWLNEQSAQLMTEAMAAAQAVAPSEPLMLPAPVEDPMMAQLLGNAVLQNLQPKAEPLAVPAHDRAA